MSDTVVSGRLLPASRKALGARGFAEPLLVVAGVLLTSGVFAAVFGLLWVLIGWMRFYGLEAGVIPQAIPLAPVDYHNPFVNWVAGVIEWYNCTFQGNARFGSGMGLIAGACFSLPMFSRSSQRTRLIAAATCGLVVGVRLSLMLTSRPLHCVAAALLASICFAVLSVSTRNTLPSLPSFNRVALCKADRQ